MRVWIFVTTLCVGAACSLSANAQEHKVPAWVARSNTYTQQLLSIELKRAPENASKEGLVRYDTRISQPTLSAEMAERAELTQALQRISKAKTKESDKHVLQDIGILEKAFNLEFRRRDYNKAHVVPFINASAFVFSGVRVLLDDQVVASRYPAAVERLKKYAGLETGFKPLTDLLKQRVLEQMAKPDVIYPSKMAIETELGRNVNYLTGMEDLFRKYQLTGWESAYASLKMELIDYDNWVRSTILPKARTDFRMPDAQYALALEGYGIDLPPTQIASMAHSAFAEYQSQMASLSADIAARRGLKTNDYRSVVAELKKAQITGDAILPFYDGRLRELEAIIKEHHILTLPDRPAVIRVATAAETAQQPAPHMSPPAFLHNTGERGEFVLPLNIPAADGGADDKYDDFTFDAVAWTLTAHEARPGHELQFDSMVEQGVSLARALYAFNSTNAEGWGLYSEYLMQPFEPAEGQLCTLQLRLLRAARAFLDPELQSGKVTPEEAYRILESDVMLSHAFAKEEVERFTYRSPGQANSYFYGYTRLLALRKQTEAALGARFDQQKFHDFILAQGLLPPDLMQKTVLDDFIPAQH
jgi:hypothetical protein